jgi:hypothetical protein
MLLHYRLDDEIEIDGKKYVVNASFDVILRVIDLLEEKRFSPITQVKTALKMLINDNLEHYTHEERIECMQQILDLYVQMKEPVTLDRAGNPMPTPPKDDSGATYSYTEDADYIYAAFMQTYGIDLIEQQGKLHWAKFKALLTGLPDNTMFSEILRIRGWDPSKEKEKYATRMNRLQKKYKLKGKEDE